jgi:hypothetical protein
MADIRMPLHTQGARSIVKISLTGNAISDQTIIATRRQQIPVCVMTAAITGFRRFSLFLEDITANTQAKGFSDKNSTLNSTSFICSMGHPLTQSIEFFKPAKAITRRREK